jgi:hypothetical protein
MGSETVTFTAEQIERIATAADTGIPGQVDFDGGEVPARDTETVYVEELRIDGTTQIALDLGGKLPQSCEVAFSGKATVDGFLRKGDRIRVEATLLVKGASADDKLDKQTGIVTEAVQKHKAVFTDLRVID